MKDKAVLAPRITAYALSIYELEGLLEEIQRCIAHERVEDKASQLLSKLRKKIRIIEERIKSKLDNIVNSPVYKTYMQDSVVSMKNGRYAVPIKSEYKKNLEGTILDLSSSGATVFIEPKEIRNLQEELNALKIEEEKDILSTR